MPARLTTCLFIERARTVHGERYGYEQAAYTGCFKRVTIQCNKHGVFEQSASKHLSGQGCPECGKAEIGNKARSNTAAFIQKAEAIHGKRYGYDEATYTTGHSKLLISCRTHGQFLQTASDHLSGKGCWECRNARIGQKLIKSLAEFIKDAQVVHGDRYDYSDVEYTGTKNRVQIICATHGAFQQTASDHLSGRGCPKCARLAANAALSILHKGKPPRVSPEARLAASAAKTANAKAKFAERATKTHGGKYDYSRSEYTAAKKSIIVICPEHGEFVASTADNHVRGQGCPECGKAGWSRSSWASAQNGREAILYLIELEGKDELFYKVGITFVGVIGRFRSGRCPYTIHTIAIFKSYDAGNVYDLEKQLHHQFKHLQYKPQLEFAGQTECFSSATEILAALPKATFFTKERPIIN